MASPSGRLTWPPSRFVFAFVRDSAAAGASVLFVSHDLDEVLELADRVTVLRDGHVVGTEATERLERRTLAELLTGGPLDPAARRRGPGHGVAASVSGLSGELVQGVSFEVRDGEVLGLTGLLGSGFEEVPYLLFGARRSANFQTIFGSQTVLVVLTLDTSSP